MKYEYKLMATDTPTASEDQLNNDFGAEGWLLQQIYEFNGSWYYVFARPITN